MTDDEEQGAGWWLLVVTGTALLVAGLWVAAAHWGDLLPARQWHVGLGIWIILAGARLTTRAAHKIRQIRRRQ